MRSKQLSALLTPIVVLSLVPACTGDADSEQASLTAAADATGPGTAEVAPSASIEPDVAPSAAPADDSTTSASVSTDPGTDEGVDQPELKSMVDEVMRRAAQSDEFKAEIKADPAGVLKREGFSLGADETVIVLESTYDSLYMVLDDRNLAKFYPQILEPATSEMSQMQQLLGDIRTRARTDDDFKMALLGDTATTLTAAGMTPELAARYTVVEYEADTHVFLLLPPPAPATRQSAAGLIDWIINFVPAFLVEQAARGVAALNVIAQDVFNISEAACFFPRLFGQQCGGTLPQIEQYLTDEVSKLG